MQNENSRKPNRDLSRYKNGNDVLGLYDGEWSLIRWSETRTCMLAGTSGGGGYFGEGWECCENNLIIDEPQDIRTYEEHDMITQALAEQREHILETLDESSFESDNGYKVEIFINWDETRKKIASITDRKQK